MATHSSVLAWRIPGMGEPSGLPSMGSHRVGHYWSDLAAAGAGISVRYWCYLSHRPSLTPPTSTTAGKWRIVQKNMIPPNGTYPLHQRKRSSARWHCWQVYWTAGSWAFYRGFNCALKSNLERRHPLCGMAWFSPNHAQLHLCLHEWLVYLAVCSRSSLARGSQTFLPDRVLAPPNMKG